MLIHALLYCGVIDRQRVSHDGLIHHFGSSIIGWPNGTLI
jgi:hypothetical protein